MGEKPHHGSSDAPEDPVHDVDLIKTRDSREESTKINLQSSHNISVTLDWSFWFKLTSVTQSEPRLHHEQSTLDKHFQQKQQLDVGAI